MPPEVGPPGPREGADPRAGAETRIRVTWLESAVARPATPPASFPTRRVEIRRRVVDEGADVGPGWSTYALATVAGALLLLATVAWPWWQRVGLWLETRIGP